MKKTKYANLNPCAWGTALGAFYGTDLLLHALSELTRQSFLWFNPASNLLFLSKVPGYSTTALGVIWAGVWGLLLGCVLGYVFVKIHNCVNTKCGSPLCK